MVVQGDADDSGGGGAHGSDEVGVDGSGSS